MSNTMRLKSWNGPQIMARARGASHEAVEKVGQDAAEKAAELAPKRTGYLASTMESRVVDTPNGPAVQVGNWKAPYALTVEIGLRGRVGHYMIRRATDEHFPKLPGEIADRF